MVLAWSPSAHHDLHRNKLISSLQLKYAYELLDEFCRLPDNIKEPYLRSGANNQGYVKPSKYTQTISPSLS